MKKIIATILSLLTFTGMAFSAPDDVQRSDELAIDDIFLFDADDFDSTTAFIDLDTESDVAGVDVDDLIAYAKRYLGKPYSHGSKGPKAFDCSGFTSFVFKNFDISLSPSSKTQATQGHKIAKSEIRPGDLLFFQGRRSSSVGHVALAIDVDETGDVTFIHAATGGVRIDRLNHAPYYQSRYICARRVLD